MMYFCVNVFKVSVFLCGDFRFINNLKWLFQNYYGNLYCNIVRKFKLLILVCVNVDYFVVYGDVGMKFDLFLVFFCNLCKLFVYNSQVYIEF